jgi:hypothetical protein
MVVGMPGFCLAYMNYVTRKETCIKVFAVIIQDCKKKVDHSGRAV